MSRLIGELKETYADRVVDWAEGRAYSYRENQPHGVILDLFNELLDLAADDTPELLDLKLEHTLNSLFGGRVCQNNYGATGEIKCRVDGMLCLRCDSNDRRKI